MRKENAEAILLAAALTMGCLTGCGAATNTETLTIEASAEAETQAGDENKTEAETQAGDENKTEAEATNDTNEDLVTVKDIYDANDIADVLSRHKNILVEYQSKQGKDDILATAEAQITQTSDGNVLFVEKMNNGEDVYDIQSYQNSGFTYVYNETTKEAAVGIIHPDDYIYYIQKRVYLEPYDSYEYTNIKNEMQDGDIVVYADIDDIGQIYIYTNPDNYDIDGIAYDFTSGVSVNRFLTYDKPKDLGITVLDDALAKGSSTVTIEYINSADTYRQDIDYVLPIGATAYQIGILDFDLYTDEECSDENYITEFIVEDHPMTIYAKNVG